MARIPRNLRPSVRPTPDPSQGPASPASSPNPRTRQPAPSAGDASVASDAATRAPEGAAPRGVDHESATPQGAATTGGSAATPTGGSAATPTGGSAATPTGGSAATPTGGSAATPTGGSAATAAYNAASTTRAPKKPRPAQRPEAGRRPSAQELNDARDAARPAAAPTHADPGVTTPGEIPEGHVLVARIGRAHGIRGQVTVEVHTDAPEIRLADGATLSASGQAARPTVTVVGSHWHSGRLLLELDGVRDRTATESLRGLLLSVPGGAEDTVPADEDDPDAYWDHQLVGLRAITAAGEPTGLVVDVLHLPGGDTLVIDHHGDELLLPFLKAFVPTVDLGAGTLTVTPPDGLW